MFHQYADGTIPSPPATETYVPSVGTPASSGDDTFLPATGIDPVFLIFLGIMLIIGGAMLASVKRRAA